MQYLIIRFLVYVSLIIGYFLTSCSEMLDRSLYPDSEAIVSFCNRPYICDVHICASRHLAITSACMSTRYALYDVAGVPERILVQRTSHKRYKRQRAVH